MWLSEPTFAHKADPCDETYKGQAQDPARAYCRMPAEKHTPTLLDDEGTVIHGRCFDCGVSGEAFEVVALFLSEIANGMPPFPGHFGDWPYVYVAIRPLLIADFTASRQELNRLTKASQ